MAYRGDDVAKLGTAKKETSLELCVDRLKNLSRELNNARGMVEQKCDNIVGMEPTNCASKDSSEPQSIVENLNYFMTLMESEVDAIRYQIGRI